jgi:hypothetical protein
LLGTVTNLVLAALLIKVPNLVEGKTPMKRTVVTMAVVNAVTWIPIVFVFMFFKNINPVITDRFMDFRTWFRQHCWDRYGIIGWRTLSRLKKWDGI